MKRKTIITLILSMSISGCLLNNPIDSINSRVSGSLAEKQTKKDFSNLDPTKSVEITILNPTNKQTVEWYKKDDNTIVMKESSQAEVIGTVILKDGTKSSNVEWQSSDNTIAVVNNGKISANKIGNTTILATSVLNPDYKGILNVEVVNAANFASNENLNKVSYIEAIISDGQENRGNNWKKINKKSFIAEIGANITAVSKVTLEDGTKNSNVIWESSDERIATVNQNGEITTSNIGFTTIVAKYKLNPNFKGIIDVQVVDNLSLKFPEITPTPVTETPNTPIPVNTPVPVFTQTPEPVSTSVPISTPTPTDSEYIPANVAFNNKNIQERYGNGDNIPNRGETVYLNPTFKNTGGVPSNRLTISTKSSSPYLIVEDSSAYIDAIKPGLNSESLSSEIRVKISNDTVPGTSIPITYTLSDSFGNKWEISDSLAVISIANSFSFNNNNYVERYGNGDNVPNRGETVYLNPTFTNTGSSSTNSLNISISSNSSFINIEDRSAYISSIKPGLTSENLSSELRVKISNDTVPGTSIPITYTLSDNFGNSWEISSEINIK